MLLLINQNLGMAWGEVPVVAILGGGSDDDSRATRKRRRRGDRDHRWDREDPLYASIELQRALTEPEALEEEDREDTLEAIEVISDAAQAKSPRGGLIIVPPPPIAVARAIVNIPDEQPMWRDVLAAVREAQRRTRNQSERDAIAHYHARLEYAIDAYQDEEDAADLLMRGIL